MQPRRDGGFTAIELLIATFVVSTMFVAFWFNYSHNQQVLNRGRDKVLLQQALSQASEAIARDVRAGAGITLSGPTSLSVFDRGGALIRQYSLSGDRLVTNGGNPVVPERCTALTFTMAPDTTEVWYVLTLEDAWLNKATVRGSACVRNLSED